MSAFASDMRELPVCSRPLSGHLTEPIFSSAGFASEVKAGRWFKSAQGGES